MTGGDDIEFDSVRQAKELFNQCRILFNKVWTGQERMGDHSSEQNKLTSDKNLIMNQQKSGSPEDGVGDLEIKPSFGIGKAPRDARPINKRNILKK